MKSTGASYNWYYTKEGGSGRRTAVFKKELYADHRCQLPVVFSAASGKNSLHRPRCVCFLPGTSEEKSGAAAAGYLYIVSGQGRKQYVQRFCFFLSDIHEI